MLPERGVVKIGLEVEVAAWRAGRTRAGVVRALHEGGYLLGEIESWAQTHTYHCNCDNGCRRVREGDVYIPPIVSMTYDASLPDRGAEFIVSPVLLVDGGLDMLRPVWDHVANNAEWTMNATNRGGGPASPSIHIHCSVTNGDVAPNDYLANETVTSDILYALWLFSPELFLLADTAGVRRKVEYRVPTRMGGHHGFVQVRRARLPNFLHIEWRLFEAAYNSWDYVRRATYTTAALTRLMLDYDKVTDILSRGISLPVSGESIRKAVLNNSTEEVLALASVDRLNLLKQLCCDELDDDMEGQALVEAFFEEAAANARS